MPETYWHDEVADPHFFMIGARFSTFPDDKLPQPTVTVRVSVGAQLVRDYHIAMLKSRLPVRAASRHASSSHAVAQH